MYDLSVSLQTLQESCDQSSSDNELLKKRIILMTKKSLIGICSDKVTEHLRLKAGQETYDIF
jgi:hypothetical protein